MEVASPMGCTSASQSVVGGQLSPSPGPRGGMLSGHAGSGVKAVFYTTFFGSGPGNSAFFLLSGNAQWPYWMPPRHLFHGPGIPVLTELTLPPESWLGQSEGPLEH